MLGLLLARPDGVDARDEMPLDSKECLLNQFDRVKGKVVLVKRVMKSTLDIGSSCLGSPKGGEGLHSSWLDR